MSLAFTRFKLRCTTYTVDVVRRFCDGCNAVLSAVGAPLASLGHRIGQESPWVVILFASSGISVFPLLLYPVLKPYLMNDIRWQKEEERVRLCLQKGIDPYPYLRHKDYVFGNVVPATQSEEEVPLEVSWEHQAMEEFQRAKEKLRKEVGGDVNDSVAKLMALRENLRREFERSRHAVSNEPRNLIFGRRGDVDSMRS
ncbi:uncharacterized protein Tco025E_00549 [Trypanosoma conorhini]|uniref:Uncharacterized protein n=1 Tax=Trypanosoma conorhini TaxID=83891 RepID=A0A422QB92_9TRYP|nr:uncharacterized protein Tco025E_00549 [Trypanosoma conorhini]RNF27241.1 hypothetical protein Tco025E_00549 [Trypanosoma conorhini]